MSVLAMMLLFVALQPGILLTLPAVGRRVFMSGKMSVQAVFVHALVFAVILHFLRRGGYFEGFAGPMGQLYPNAAPWTAEGFAGQQTPTQSVVKETAAFAVELVSPNINAARIKQIRNWVGPRSASENTKISQIDRTLYMTINSMIHYANIRVTSSAPMPKPTSSVLAEIRKFASDLISPTISVVRFNEIKARLVEMVKDSKLNLTDRMLYNTIISMIPHTSSRLPGSTSSSSRVVARPPPGSTSSSSRVAAAISPVSSIKNAITPNVSMGMPLSTMPAGMSGSFSPMSLNAMSLSFLNSNFGSRGSSSSLARLPPGITPAQAAILGLKI